MKMLETKENYMDTIEETKTAIKVLVELYPGAARNEPRSAGIVLRRFQLRERDLFQVLEIKE